MAVLASTWQPRKQLRSRHGAVHLSVIDNVVLVTLTTRQTDCLDKLAAALQAKLGVPVTRDALAQVILDSGLQEMVAAAK